MNIKLHSIARQKSRDDSREELFAGEVTVEGLLGDHSTGIESGEIGVLSKESWAKVCHESGTELPWFSHSSTLLIKGFEFLPTDVGRTIHIGEVTLQITREDSPAENLKQQAPALFESLLLGCRSGVVCKVLRSGTIQSGDKVDIAG